MSVSSSSMLLLRCRLTAHRRAAVLGVRTSLAKAYTSVPYTLLDGEEADDAIPQHPTWSVHELISSYPRPQISNETLKKLHQLSALVPPEEGSSEHERMRRELEELVRLVEAVKLVDTGGGSTGETTCIVDGRVWPEGMGMALTKEKSIKEFEGVEEGESGANLLKYASDTRNGLYTVESERSRNR